MVRSGQSGGEEGGCGSDWDSTAAADAYTWQARGTNTLDIRKSASFSQLLFLVIASHA